MDKLQYDSFHKFMVSLGIILITLPIVAYIFLIKSEPIILSQNDFNTLSTFSLKNISEKEHIIENFTRYLSFSSIILILLGRVLIIYGCKKWSKIQKQLDAQIEYDTTIKQINAQKMSAPEIALKTAEEVLEAETIEDCDEITNNTLNTISTSQNYMLKYMQIEDSCFSKISEQYSKKYNLKRYLRIGKYEYDFIGISKKDNIDLIFDVKYWRQIPSTKILKSTLQRLFSSGVNYENNARRNFKIILIIVSPREKINRIKSQMVDKNLNFEFGFNIEIRYFVEEDL